MHLEIVSNNDGKKLKTTDQIRDAKAKLFKNIKGVTDYFFEEQLSFSQLEKLLDQVQGKQMQEPYIYEFAKNKLVVELTTDGNSYCMRIEDKDRSKKYTFEIAEMEKMNLHTDLMNEFIGMNSKDDLVIFDEDYGYIKAFVSENPELKDYFRKYILNRSPSGLKDMLQYISDMVKLQDLLNRGNHTIIAQSVVDKFCNEEYDMPEIEDPIDKNIVPYDPKGVEYIIYCPSLVTMNIEAQIKIEQNKTLSEKHKNLIEKVLDPRMLPIFSIVTMQIEIMKYENLNFSDTISVVK